MSEHDHDPIHLEALALVTSLSRRNLRHGLTYWCYVPRGRVTGLAKALEARYPGAIDAVLDQQEAKDE